jgi:hypothetical protein
VVKRKDGAGASRPHGNLTSQFWCTCFLHPLDQLINRELRCPAYLLYVGGMALLADSWGLRVLC